MSPALAAAFILFNGHNLDGWKTLSGEWAAEGGAIICKQSGTIRSSFESDAYTLEFDYRRASGSTIMINASLDGDSGDAHSEWFRMKSKSGIDALDSRLLEGDDSPSDEWIMVQLSVNPKRLVIASVRNTHEGRPHGASLNRKFESGKRRRGFIAFRSEKPGLQIRNVRVSEPGFTSLFDGKSIKGWEPVGRDDSRKPNWTAKDGLLVCGHYEGYGNWLRTQEPYDNFILRLEYWLPEKGNSGVYLHAPLEGRVSQIGQEIQLLDDAGWGGTVKPAQRNGSVYAGIAPQVDVPAPAKEWNAIEIFSQGKHIRTTVNGVELYDARLDDASKDVQLLHHPLATRRLTGFIGLQDHTGEPRFRNIRIRTLPPESQPARGE